jgi:myxalamid-type polyketide synthase MxaB
MAAGMAARDTARMAAQGFQAIAPAHGFRTLAQLLLQDETHACVLSLSWDTYLRNQYHGALPPFFTALPRGPSAPDRVAQAPSAILATLEGALAGQRRTLLVDYVQRQVAAVLGESEGGAQDIKPRERLFDLGIDSLMAVDLKNRLQAELHLTLGATLVFDYPTIEALVDHLLEELAFAKGPPPTSEKDSVVTTGGAASSVADIELETASPDDIARMLAMELDVEKGTW